VRTPRLSRCRVSLANRPSTALAQEAGSRGEVESEALMPLQPGSHLRVLVGGIVVEHHVDRLVGRYLALDGIEKTDEFLMPVALHATPDDLAFEDIEGGKQGDGAVLFVVLGHGGVAPLFHRQPGLGAVERLDLPFLVDAEDDHGLVDRHRGRPHP
jgi:hypothetical protein